MEFGSVVRERRLASQMSLQGLATVAKVDAGTVSRIENRRTQATLSTAAQLCDALDINFQDLAALTTKEREVKALIQFRPKKHSQILTSVDLERFEILFYTKYRQGRAVLADMLKRIWEVTRSTNPLVDKQFTRITENDIEHLLSDNPLYSFELRYPSDVDAADIFGFHHGGGVITPVDVRAFLIDLQDNVLPDCEVPPLDVLNRLRLTSIEKAKVEDIMELDALLGCNSEIVGLYWKANKFGYQAYERYNAYVVITEELSRWRNRYEPRLSSTVVAICRWAQATHLDDSWLFSLRSQVAELTREYASFWDEVRAPKHPD